VILEDDSKNEREMLINQPPEYCRFTAVQLRNWMINLPQILVVQKSTSVSKRSNLTSNLQQSSNQLFEPEEEELVQLVFLSLPVWVLQELGHVEPSVQSIGARGLPTLPSVPQGGHQAK